MHEHESHINLDILYMVHVQFYGVGKVWIKSFVGVTRSRISESDRIHEFIALPLEFNWIDVCIMRPHVHSLVPLKLLVFNKLFLSDFCHSVNHAKGSALNGRVHPRVLPLSTHKSCNINFHTQCNFTTSLQN